MRQRKDIFGGNQYYKSIMNDDPAILESSVAELLMKNPQAVRVFINHHTACVGCYLARFCTVNEVIDIYSLDEDEFIKEVAKLTVQKS